MTPFRTTVGERVEYRFHAGQRSAMECRKRFILVLAGWQSGKTSIGSPWLYNEIQRCGPGDYLVATPNFALADKKVLPEFLGFFHRDLRIGDEAMGRMGYHGTRHVFTFSEAAARAMFGERYDPSIPTQVFFGHADSPDSLESATYKAAWLDEAGQKAFKYPSWEAILGRLSLASGLMIDGIPGGRVLITTRPYDLGWLKQKIWDDWNAAGRNHPDIEIIGFRSIDNPAFPEAEYLRAKRSMPGWRFRQKYEGLFERPAGQIYDCFEPELNVLPSHFYIDPAWPQWIGLDFGGLNTAAVHAAEELGPVGNRTGRLIVYKTYHPQAKMTAANHVRQLLQGYTGSTPLAVGGAPSEDQWRDEFRAAGLPVRNPDIKGPDAVEVGIERVYAAFKARTLMVLDHLVELRDEINNYSRELDDMGEPTEKIENKDYYHLLDATRYLMVYLRRGTEQWILPPENRRDSVLGSAPAGVFLAGSPDDV